jgi:lipid II:glycine glycyltransferase (peptidoglycan interpeptide bridge formation enzyme)
MLKLLQSELKDDMFLRVDANHEYSYSNSRRVKDVQPSTTLITNLKHDEAELFEGMHKKTRYNIRLAEKKGVEIQIGVDALKVFVELVKETSERHGIASHGEAHYQAIMKHLDGSGDKPRAFIALAIHDDDVLAAAMCIDWNGTRTYLHGASSDVKKNLMAPHLLHWKLMDNAKTSSITSYDWWGIAPEENSSHPLMGVTRFKKGFGGEIVSSPNTFDIIQKSMWYKVYSLIRKFK